jgi:hypothetical protein
MKRLRVGANTMSLKGAAFLALWNDIEPAREAEYNIWHAREHVPERLTVPGIVSARRYVSPDSGMYRYFTLYDIESPNVLKSPRYVALMQGPSEWSLSMRPAFRNFVRNPCALLASLGRGIGGAVATFRFWPAQGAPELTHAAARAWIESLFKTGPVTAAHLGVADTAAPCPIKGAPEEKNGPRYVLVVEANDAAGLTAIVPALTAALASDLQAREPVTVNTYTLAFAIDRADLGDPPTPLPPELAAR